MKDKTSFKDRSTKLQQIFINQLPGRISTGSQLIDSLSNKWQESRPPEKDELETLLRLFHNLKGTSASFGMTTISSLAKEGEDLCHEILETLEDEPGALLTQYLRKIRDVVTGLANLEPKEETPPITGLDLERWSRQVANPHKICKDIYLCDDDPLQLAQISRQLGCFGHQIHCFEHTQDLVEAIRKQPPDVLIMDVVFPEGSMAGIEAVNQVKQELGKEIPSIFISGRDSFNARLEAVRAGGLAYCIKPVAIMDLVEFLDGLCGSTLPEPYRILVVDDDQALAEYHALILEQAGMQVRVETDPTRVLEVLTGFNPDLVLMDLYMPKCAGQELSMVLRQIPGYLSLPIVYLSSETEEERKLAALKVGVEGFLHKPIEPQRLVAEVCLRAERMRTLRQLMMRDSLTGLYNHSNIKRILEQELARSQRNKSPLVLAMLDIDHFKQVNDLFGHAMGDQILTTLARLLRQRLRQSDYVGRYGGEEFAIILPDTTKSAADRLLNELRESFANLRFLSKSTEFHVTFSCGLAASEHFPVASDLFLNADLALYQAKHAGRNQVTVAEPKK